MSELTWDVVLTDLETRVSLAEQALDEGTDLDTSLVQPWAPPEGLGPLPSRLRDRAVHIIALQAEIELRISNAKDQLSREIGNLNNGSRKLSAYGETVIPKYFDSAV